MSQQSQSQLVAGATAVRVSLVLSLNMAEVRPQHLENYIEERKTSNILEGMVYFVGLIAQFLGILPMKWDNNMNFSFSLFSWTSFFSFIRLVVFNSPFTVFPLVLYYGGYMYQGFEIELDLNITELVMNDTINTIYEGSTVQIVYNLLTLANFLYYILPFNLCYQMTNPLMNLFQTVLKPSNLEKHLITPNCMLLLPILCFLLMALGNFMSSLAWINISEETYPGSSSLLFLNLGTFGTDFHFMTTKFVLFQARQALQTS